MSEEKQKIVPESPTTKEDEANESLGPETLENVIGGMMPAIPGFGGTTSLPSDETAVCISQS